jgi:catechol 2,3-dioxygenase-like lactoylglutathione lyase family enzyme/uncharacterized damage-inducible protein DinB
MKQIEIKRIIEQIELLFNDNNWVGLNLDDVFNSINDEIANYKMPMFNKTIHQIARHIASDIIVVRRLQGIDYKLTEKEDWTPIEEMNHKWIDTVNEIKNNKNELIHQLNLLSDDILNQQILPGNKSIYLNVHGFIQHAYYHFGQIAIMQKAIKTTIETIAVQTSKKNVDFNCLIPELLVRDIRVSKAFYINILGFKIDFEREEDEFLHISLGKAQIMLVGENHSWITGDLSYPRGRGINLQIECDNLITLYNKIQRLGLNIFEKIQKNCYRIDDIEEMVIEFLIQDPDGYLLRFQEYQGVRLYHENMN